MDMNNLLTILLLVASVTAFFFLLRSRGRGSEAERDLALMRGELEQQRERFQEREELLKKSGEELQNAFKALSAEALKSNREDFLALAQRELEKKQIEAKGELEKREQAVKSLVDPINKNLDEVRKQIQEVEKERKETAGGLNEQLKRFSEDQEKLRSETAQLVTALRKPSVRGQWGEMQLKRVVEMAGMLDRCDFQTQAQTDSPGQLRPDLIVKLPGKKIVVVDAKTPLDAYLDALDIEDETRRKEELVRHARHLRTHISALSKKAYWEQFETTPEFVVMFLPSESIFYAALEQDPSLIEEGVAQKVILATPTTLIALLRTVAYGWQQESLAENAQRISELGRDLYARLGTLSKHFGNLGKSLDKSVEHYNSAVGSLETRVLTAARKFPELSIGEEGGVSELKQVDLSARELQSPELSDSASADKKS
jgi:DNA recombination protein RmuC